MKQFGPAVLIVCYRSHQYLEAAIEAARAATRTRLAFSILGIGDREECGRIAEACLRQKVAFMSRCAPCSFAQACNRLAKTTTRSWMLFLNPDTIAEVDSIDRMIEESHRKNVSVVGARLVYPNGMIQHAGIAWPDGAEPRSIGYHTMPIADYSGSQEAEAVSAAAMLVYRERFRELEGFDEGFINGYEDIDFCLRVRKSGYHVRYCGDAVVVHYESASMGTTGKVPTSLEFLDHNRALLYKKWRPSPFIKGAQLSLAS